jgi:hypothetical protein
VTLFVARVIRVISIVVCLIAMLSFLLFAINRTSTASGQQQEALVNSPKQAEGRPARTHSSESGFHSTIDEIADEASSPVAGISSSQWGERALRLLFVLLVFGFALGYLARVIRVRS